MNEKLNITQWAEEDRPREKMLLHGPAALSNAELLAILIGSGNTEETAVELMRKVLDDCHNRLSELGKYTVDDLCRYKGIGPAKAVTILAASELGKRRREEEPSERKKITSSQDVYAFFHPTKVSSVSRIFSDNSVSNSFFCSSSVNWLTIVFSPSSMISSAV